MRAAVDQSTKQMTFWVNSWHLTVIRQQIFVVSLTSKYTETHFPVGSTQIHCAAYATPQMSWLEIQGGQKGKGRCDGKGTEVETRETRKYGTVEMVVTLLPCALPRNLFLHLRIFCCLQWPALILYRRRRFINHLLTYLLTSSALSTDLLCPLQGSLAPSRDLLCSVQGSLLLPQWISCAPSTPPGISCSLQGPLVLRPGISSAPSTDLLCPLQGSRAPSRDLLCSVQGSTVTLQLSQIRKSSQDSPQWQIYQSRRIPINTHSRYRYIGYTHLALAASMSNVSFVSCLRNFIIAGMSFCQHHTNNIASHKQYHI